MDKLSIEQVYKEIMNSLGTALGAQHTAMWRQRYASTEQWEEEKPRLLNAGKVSWMHAKALIGHYRMELGSYITNNPDILPDDLAAIRAAFAAIDKEVNEQMEKILTEEKGESMIPRERLSTEYGLMAQNHASDNDSGSEYIPQEVIDASDEYDEDEAYVRDTSGFVDEEDEQIWDGDDYIPLTEDEDLDEEF